jgi:hypothetical protein
MLLVGEAGDMVAERRFACAIRLGGEPAEVPACARPGEVELAILTISARRGA